MTLFRSLLLVSMCIALVACEPPDEKGTPEKPSNPIQMRLSFKELKKLGQNYACTFVDTDEAGNTSHGLIYLHSSEKKFRGDFRVVQASGETYDASVIRTGNTSYVWTSLAQDGFMMRVEDTDRSLFGTSNTNEGMGMNEDEAVDFTCRNWDIDDTVFIAPSDRTFKDTASFH